MVEMGSSSHHAGNASADSGVIRGRIDDLHRSLSLLSLSASTIMTAVIACVVIGLRTVILFYVQQVLVAVVLVLLFTVMEFIVFLMTKWNLFMRKNFTESGIALGVCIVANAIILGIMCFEMVVSVPASVMMLLLG